MNDRRGKTPVDPMRPYGALIEKERTGEGDIEETATLFLTNRECPFRCLMCDLWRHTTEQPVPPGAIPAQIRAGLSGLPEIWRLKLYNGGSFFDPGAIPPEDYPEIAGIVRSFKFLLVESHPAFIGDRTLKFMELLQGDEGLGRNRTVPLQLQVAMGLETVHPEVLPRLNKQMTLDDFQRASQFLLSHGISVRAFILLRPPFLSEEEGVEWACRSIDFAFENGVSVCSVIPVRGGTPAMDKLAASGQFAEPSVESLESVLSFGIGRGKGLVFADLWDLERFSTQTGFPEHRERLNRMNLRQGG